jgi:hypothetical protein
MWCLRSCNSLEEITLEANSQLRRIKSGAFAESGLRRIRTTAERFIAVRVFVNGGNVVRATQLSGLALTRAAFPVCDWAAMVLAGQIPGPVRSNDRAWRKSAHDRTAGEALGQAPGEVGWLVRA